MIALTDLAIGVFVLCCAGFICMTAYALFKELTRTK